MKTRWKALIFGMLFFVPEIKSPLFAQNIAEENSQLEAEVEVVRYYGPHRHWGYWHHRPYYPYYYRGPYYYYGPGPYYYGPPPPPHYYRGPYCY